jgi:hypothetical protein
MWPLGFLYGAVTYDVPVISPSAGSAMAPLSRCCIAVVWLYSGRYGPSCRSRRACRTLAGTRRISRSRSCKIQRCPTALSARSGCNSRALSAGNGCNGRILSERSGCSNPLVSADAVARVGLGPAHGPLRQVDEGAWQRCIRTRAVTCTSIQARTRARSAGFGPHQRNPALPSQCARCTLNAAPPEIPAL